MGACCFELDANSIALFSLSPQEQATDIILTLGQAFELAYQMALRDQVTGRTKSGKDGGTYKSQAVSPGTASSYSRDARDSSGSRFELKLNGHPLKMQPLTLSIAAETVVDPKQVQRTPTKVEFGEGDG